MTIYDYIHQFVGTEKEKYWIFRKQHWEKCHNTGTYTIKLSGTGIGEMIEITCPICKEIENITDTDAW